MKNFLKVFVFVFSLLYYFLSFASGVDHFEVEIDKTKIDVKETLDITITAVDENSNVVEDYDGEILIFSETDPKAEFPGVLSESIYQFTKEDLGSRTFENAVNFTQAGLQVINIYDINNENIFGIVEVDVTEDKEAQTGEIAIGYPESGITVGSSTIRVNGTTLKNHNVKVVLNGELEKTTISAGEGIYEVEFENVPSGKNTLKAELLDADENVIGESEEVLFSVDVSVPIFKSIELSPSLFEYLQESVVNVEVNATAGLTSLEIILSDTVFELSESSNGNYTGEITLPSESGEYRIDINMKNELGNEKKENGVYLVNIKTELPAAGEEESIELNCDDLKKELEIKNIKTVKLRTKSVISWDEVEKANGYNIYKKDKRGTGMTFIENVSENKYEIVLKGDIVEYDDFAVKAVFKDDVCNVESSDFSDMTKVQTGPKELAVILFFSFLIGLVIVNKKKILKK